MSTSPQAVGPRTIFVSIEHEPEITQEVHINDLAYNIHMFLPRPTALGYLYSSISLNLVAYWEVWIIYANTPTRPAGDQYLSIPLILGLNLLSLYHHRVAKVHLLYLPPGYSDITHNVCVTTSFHFLVVSLPEVLEISSPSGPAQGTSNREVLLQIFSRVPFDMFKEAIESPNFQIGSDQSRFKFAKDAIEIRKRGIARGPGCEETVVLAFGGGYSGGSAVHVTRKMRKRQLWKVNS
ncbi:hypothetical protein VNI00_003418 [Paramarasmius palmivorus]|uniref:Uncharacterized protein n=1 Tax=Paramarasmius palmivorus TaxID=297713 RepID=A0AAW0DUA2_9AGAR